AQSRWLWLGDYVNDHGAPVSALGNPSLAVPDPVHQLGPGAGNSQVVPARLARPVGESESWERGNDHVKGVLGRSAVSDWVDKRSDRIEELDGRTWPAVRQDQRQSVLVRGLGVDEMDPEAVQQRPTVFERVDLGFQATPVVTVRPVPDELLDFGERD